jgi:hypothetical protein
MNQTHEEIATGAAVPLPAVKAHLCKRRTTYSAQLARYLEARGVSPDCPQPVHQDRSDGPSKRERL